MPEGHSDDIALAIEQMEAEKARLKRKLPVRDEVRYAATNVISYGDTREMDELGWYEKGFLDGLQAAVSGRPPLVLEYGLPYRRRKLHLADLKASFGRYDPTSR